MKSYSSREVMKILKKNGWHEVRVKGSHHQFRHPIKKGTVTVKAPEKTVPIGTLKSIEKHSGIKFK